MSEPGTSSYFSNEPGLVQEFELDYEKYIKFQTDLSFYQSVCIPHPITIVLSPILYCVYMTCGKQNVIDTINATHVAVTRDGIKFVVDRHASGCRCQCQEVGKVSKTVPFDKITDCDVQEPAGASCCGLVPNILYAVNVDTASTAAGQHELSVVGLKDPYGFKDLVWRMKRGEVQLPADIHLTSGNSSDAAGAPVSMVMNRGGVEMSQLTSSVAAGGAGSAKATQLLESIEKRLDEQNNLLRQLVELAQQQQPR